MSNLPETTVYGGPKSKSPWKRVTLRHLEAKYHSNQPITMVTAYDYPSGSTTKPECDARWFPLPYLLQPELITIL